MLRAQAGTRPATPPPQRKPRQDRVMTFSAKPAIPILRIFDRHKAHEFYVGYLGFGID
jgi:hypothetical protein